MNGVICVLLLCGDIGYREDPSTLTTEYNIVEFNTVTQMPGSNFEQFIFWDWSPETARFHAMGWYSPNNIRKHIHGIWLTRDFRRRMYLLRFYDRERNVTYHIYARSVYSTHTSTDRELGDRYAFPGIKRRGLPTR